MELQVLVAAMGQEDLSLAKKMNIARPAILANQCGRWDYRREGEVEMISSATRGVGKNRNLALSLAQGEILLFADDDIVFYEADLQGVVDAFRELPDADVIFFGIDMTKNGEVFDARRCSVKRLHLWNSMRYGACRMAVRRKSLEKHGLQFSTLFGGGCIYGSGEDTVLIRDCFRKGLKLYTHPYVLGACAKDSSTWFTGYNDKYFFDRGAMLACAFPKGKHLVKYYFAWRLKKKSAQPLGKILRLMTQGIKAFPKLETYNGL